MTRKKDNVVENDIPTKNKNFRMSYKPTENDSRHKRTT